MNIIHADKNKPIYLGHQGENITTTVIFDIAEEWKRQLGDGQLSLTVRQPGSKSDYPVPIDNLNQWIVSSADVSIAGAGYVQLSYIVGDMVKKSEIYSTIITGSLGMGEMNPPTLIQSWIDNANKVLAEAHEVATHLPKVSENNTWLIYDNDINHYIDTGINSRGIQGIQGIQGEKGNVMYAAFDIDPFTGELSMIYDEEYKGAMFNLNKNGELEVNINA